ncbi:MAG: AAA family ATPase [Actinobacteria bacterium]|nr:AAA family ATPase [Actinomycetota bacterium]
MPTMVALVTASQELRSSFGTVVAEAPEIELVGVVSSTNELNSLVQETPDLDVVVVDAGMFDPPGLEVVRELGLNAPLVAVVVVGNATTTLAAVVAAGGRAMLNRPLSLQEVQSQLETAAAWSRSLRQHVSGNVHGGRNERGGIVALAGAKGGVGTSVLATVLATQAAALGETVCLVDLDLRAGDLAFLCGVSPRRNISDLAGLVGDLTIRGIREVTVEVPAGFTLLAAPDRVEQADDASAPAVRQMLNELRRHFSVIVVDAGSALDDARAAALELADEAILVADCELISIRAGRRTLDAWDRLSVRESGGVRLVVNRTDRRREVQPDLVAKLVKVPLTRAFPDVVDEVEEPVNSGQLTSARMPQLERVARQLLGDLGIGTPVNGAALEPATAGVRHRRPFGLRARTEAGSAAVELPVFITIFLIAFFAAAQALAVGLGYIVAGNAANEVARAASVGATDAQIAATADHAMGGFRLEPRARVNRAAHTVTVEVSVPQLYGWLPEGLDHASASTSYIPED